LLVSDDEFEVRNNLASAAPDGLAAFQVDESGSLLDLLRQIGDHSEVLALQVDDQERERLDN
jgi:hypothetical protein